MASTMSGHQPNETSARVSRCTKAGRKLTYALTVIQQPERARACGSGAKSSADRRPVDPPPVVELRIYEGDGPDPEDITFAYTANFFLFATLEVARPIAHARGQQQAPAPQVPVLTGMPVSGMAYLDRPTEAGYFIFPDLSVRHEGKYRLSFNLYEQIKEEDKDGDAEPAQKKPDPAGMEGPDSSFDWRLEVKSAAFQVFSAKKFPGLTESTMLSRTVAEQGCRVRIRRDIRMRRREGKASDDYNDHVPEDYARSGRPLEQEEYRERSRSRSTSSGSEGDRAPYPGQQNRGEFSGPPPYQPYPPQPAQHSAPPQGYLDFGRSSAPQYQAPAPPQFAPPPPAAHQSYQSNSNTFPPGPPQYRPTQPAPAPPQSNYGGYERQYPHSAYPSNPPREQREYEPEWRRASVGQPASVAQQSPYPAVDSNYNRPPHGYHHRPHSPTLPSLNLAPLKMQLSEQRYEGNSQSGPLPSVNRTIPSLPVSVYDRPAERHGSYSQYPAPIPAPLEPVRNAKRPYDAVFAASASAVNQPLHNGRRPSSSHNQSMFEDDDDQASAEELSKMSYKRADGSSQERNMPTLE